MRTATRTGIFTAALLAASLSLFGEARAQSLEVSEISSEPSYTLADTTLFAALGLGLVHHVDHVIRDNHSGFPFKRQVTPFTPSLLVYPILLAPYYLDGGPLANLLSTGSVFAGVQLAHIFAEPPADQYDPWVDETNLLGVRSRGAGRAAQVASIALSAVLVANLGANLLDGFKYGFTWKRTRRPGDRARASILPFASGDGGGLALSLSLD